MTALTASNVTTPTHSSEAFWGAATDLESVSYLSFDRCVDWLLDLYRHTDDEDLQLLIGEVIDDLRALGPIEDEFEDIVLGALASVETAFEIKAMAA